MSKIFRVVIMLTLISTFLIGCQPTEVNEPLAGDNESTAPSDDEPNEESTDVVPTEETTEVTPTEEPDRDTWIRVFGGNNEGSDNPDTNIWFAPAEAGKHGRIFFGWDVRNYPQGGMNEKGLFFDAAVTKAITVQKDSLKPEYNGQLIIKAMEECSNVDEVIDIFKTFDYSGKIGGHYLVGDQYGNSIIIDPNGIIKKTKLKLI